MGLNLQCIVLTGKIMTINNDSLHIYEQKCLVLYALPLVNRCIQQFHPIYHVHIPSSICILDTDIKEFVQLLLLGLALRGKIMTINNYSLHIYEQVCLVLYELPLIYRHSGIASHFNMRVIMCICLDQNICILDTGLKEFDQLLLLRLAVTGNGLTIDC